MPCRLPYRFLALLLLATGLIQVGTSHAQDLPTLQLPAAVEPPPGAIPPPPRFDLPAQPLPTVSLNRPSAAGTTSSTSGSRQFIVYGPELRVRNGLAARCDEISAELSRLLRTQDPWVHPIVVQIHTLGPADPPNLGITSQSRQLENEGFHLQLTVPERNGLKPGDLKKELVQLLLTERILRTHKAVSSNREPLLPYWVHTGVMAALDYRHRARPSAVFAAIFKSGQVYGIEQILDSQPAHLDGLSRTIYETSCCALVLALLDQPEGPRLFSRFLAALATDNKPEREMLSQWFPGLAESDASLNKWWSLQLASLASPSIAETLPPTETAELLDRALTFFVNGDPATLPDPRSVTSIASQRPDAPPPADPVAMLPVSSPAKPTAASPPATPPAAKPAVTASKPKATPAATPAVASAEEEATETDEGESKSPGILRRMLTFGLGSKDDDDSPEENPAEPAKKVATPTRSVPAPEPASDPEESMTREQRRELRRLEDARKDEERRLAKLAEEEAKAAEKAARTAMEAERAAAKAAEKESAKNKPTPTVAEQKPAAKPAPAKPAPSAEKTAEKPAEAPSKGGSLNPLKWFRGKKTEDTPPSDSGASVVPQQPESPFLFADDRPLIPRDLLGLQRGRFIQAPNPPTSPASEPEPALPAPVEPLSPDSFNAPPLPPMVGLDDPTLPPLTATPLPPPLAAAAAAGIAYPIEDYAVILAQPDRDRLLKQAALSLQDLAFRGNVLFREIAREYSLVIKDMQEGKTKDLDTKLANLRIRAIEIYQTACAVQDHLDWYEASQSKEFSGLFEDFLTLPERINEELPPRLDPISTYLDQVERQLGR